MRKFLALLLAVMMIASMSVTAFAASAEKTDTKNTDGDSAQDVYVVSTLANSEPVYQVVVTWKALNFTYSFGSDAEWDPATHTYTNTDGGKWQVNGVDGNIIEEAIKVENHSNADVWITAKYVQEVQNYGVNATLTNNGVTQMLENAEGKTLAETATVLYNLSVDADDVPTQDQEFKLGAITVTFSTTES